MIPGQIDKINVGPHPKDPGTGEHVLSLVFTYQPLRKLSVSGASALMVLTCSSPDERHSIRGYKSLRSSQSRHNIESILAVYIEQVADDKPVL